jgi:hypothetical protein
MNHGLKNNLYICIWIVGIDPPMKVDSRTPLPDTSVRDNLKTGIMKEIKLNKGFVALVDDVDYDWLNQWKWHAVGCKKHGFYAARAVSIGHYKVQDLLGLPRQKLLRMHRVIMNTPEGFEVDHKDRNTLNNQRYNLKNCTHGENQLNQGNWGKSKFRGVNLTPSKNAYGKIYPRITAQINIKGKIKHLGCFKTEEDAARKYDEVAKEIYGELANVNFKD